MSSQCVTFPLEAMYSNRTYPLSKNTKREACRTVRILEKTMKKTMFLQFREGLCFYSLETNVFVDWQFKW